MSTPTTDPVSARGLRRAQVPQGPRRRRRSVGLPAGTEIFSADNHISVADDIFYERFPEELKGAAPRIWYEDGAYMVGMKGKAWTGGDFGRVLMQYDDLAGAASNNIEARIRELAEDGIDKELAFPNAVLALFHYPDKSLRERVFRIYNEHIADLQERSQGPLLRRRADQLVGPEGHPQHARRAEVAWAQDVPAAAEPRQGRRRQHLRLRQHRHGRGLGRDRGGRRAGQPPHRRDAAEDAVPEQQRRRRHDGERRLVPRAVRQVRLLRHPGPASDAEDRLVRGWNRLGANGPAGCRAHAGLLPPHVQPSARPRRPPLLERPHVRLVHGRSARAASSSTRSAWRT